MVGGTVAIFVPGRIVGIEGSIMSRVFRSTVRGGIVGIEGAVVGEILFSVCHFAGI